MVRLIVPALVGFALAVFPHVCHADDASPPVERVLVLPPSPVKNETPADRTARTSTYDAIVQQLVENGLRVVDRAAAEKASLQIAATHDIDTSANRAAAFGLKFFAEYSVYYTTSTIVRDGEESKGALVRVSSRIIDNAAAHVVASKVAEASSTGLSTDDAVSKASRAAAKKLGSQLVASLEKVAADSRDRGRLFTVVLENPSREADVLDFVTLLEKTRGILAVREVESGGGKSTIEIMYRGKRDALDRVLTEAAVRVKWRISRVRAEGSRSSWRIE